MFVASGIVVGGPDRCRGHSRSCWRYTQLLGWGMHSHVHVGSQNKIVAFSNMLLKRVRDPSDATSDSPALGLEFWCLSRR